MIRSAAVSEEAGAAEGWDPERCIGTGTCVITFDVMHRWLRSWMPSR